MSDFYDILQDIERTAEADRQDGRQTYTVDGVKYCAVCHKPLEIQRVVFGITKLLPIMCDCEKEAERQKAEAKRLQALADARRKCFSGDYSRLQRARLSMVEIERPKEAAIFKKYVRLFKDMYTNQQGLLIYGPNGTGKSFSVAALCNELIDTGHEVKFTTFARIDQELGSGTRADRKTYIDSLNEYALLVLDDLGAERGSEYMQELIFSVIDSRYSSGKPMIITTNLSMHDLKNPQTAQQSRIYDRILQVCYPIEMTGASIRRKDTKKRYFDMQKVFEGADDNG